jgi:hypothetical protein
LTRDRVTRIVGYIIVHLQSRFRNCLIGYIFAAEACELS